MDALLRPEYFLLLLEDHTRPFLLLATPPASRMTRSCYSTKPGLTSHAERRRPKMVLERTSSPSDPPHTDPRSPSDPSRISPVPLQTQSPAHHLPAARRASSSPLRMESQFPPRSTSQRNAERSITSPSPPSRIISIHLAHLLSVSASGSSTVGRPLELVAIPHPWLFPPSAPPWATVKAVARVQLSSSCSKPLLPPSSSHGLCLPAPSWVSVLLLSLLPNSHPFLPLLYLR